MLSLVSKEHSISLAEGESWYWFLLKRRYSLPQCGQCPSEDSIWLQDWGQGEATERQNNDKVTGVFCDLVPFLMIAIILVFQLLLLDRGRMSHCSQNTHGEDVEHFYSFHVFCQPVSEAVGNWSCILTPRGLEGTWQPQLSGQTALWQLSKHVQLLSLVYVLMYRGC